MFSPRALVFFLALALPALALLAAFRELAEPAFALYYAVALTVTALIGNALYDYTDGGRR